MSAVIAPAPDTPAPPDLDRMPADALLSAADLARLLSCSIRHVRRMDCAGELPPPVRLGALVRWRAGRLRDWLRDMERRARR
jgi:predicted DNA-binding transcriptional regulator AlpA